MSKDAQTKALLEDVAERIESAWRTLNRLPDKERGQLRATSAAWPSMMRNAWIDGYSMPEKTRVQLPPPSARDISQMDEVLDWMLWLARQHRDYHSAVYLSCARRMATVDAAKQLSVHRDTALAWRKAGLMRVVQHFRISAAC